MLDHGAPCPKCPSENPGRIVSVDSRRKAPRRYYGSHVGSMGPAITKYRCDRGHAWEEREP